MVLTKINIKNSASYTGVGLLLLLIVGVFFSAFTYIDYHTKEANITMDARYQDTWDNLTDSTDNLQGNVETIKTNAQGVTEAESDSFAVWNGMKGIGNTLLLVLNFMTSSLKVTTSFLGFGSEMIPGWAYNLISIAISLLLVFLSIKVLMGAAQYL